jgi:hypothetical protein
VQLPNSRVIADKASWLILHNFDNKMSILKSGPDAVILRDMFQKTKAWDFSGELNRVKQTRLQGEVDEAARHVMAAAADSASAEKERSANGKVRPASFATPPSKRRKSIR